MRKRVLFVALNFILLITFAAPGFAQELSGYLAAESRFFPQAGLDSRQHDLIFSLSLQPEIYVDWDGGSQSVLFVPFLRYDQYDQERTHWDFRELYWLYYSDNYEIRAGMRKVFWGVTESQHLVDVINQTDFVENLDGEDKLGQPMLQFTLIQDWGSLDLFIMSGFRERTFPGSEGRLRFPFEISTASAGYEAANKEWHMDWALRWAHAIGLFDIGLSYFYGTSREPRYIFKSAASVVPFYDLMNQSGVDIQFTSEGWLLKLEAITRVTRGRRFIAFTGGFEYTLSNFSDSGMDLGLIGEYLFDDRDQTYFPPNPFNQHIFAGTRLAFNDVQSTDILAGAVIDSESGSMFINMEASRRLGDRWKLNLELRGFGKIDRNDFFYAFRKDSYAQAELEFYF